MFSLERSVEGLSKCPFHGCTQLCLLSLDFPSPTCQASCQALIISLPEGIFAGQSKQKLLKVYDFSCNL